MVIEDYLASDHQYITFRVRDVIPVRRKTPKAPAKWSVTKMDPQKLTPALIRGQLALESIPDNFPVLAKADEMVEVVMSHLH